MLFKKRTKKNILWIFVYQYYLVSSTTYPKFDSRRLPLGHLLIKTKWTTFLALNRKNLTNSTVGVVISVVVIFLLDWVQKNKVKKYKPESYGLSIPKWLDKELIIYQNAEIICEKCNLLWLNKSEHNQIQENFPQVITSNVLLPQLNLNYRKK